MLISFIAALGIMDGKPMRDAETKMAQMSLQVWRRVKEKYYSSIIKFHLKSVFIRKNYMRKEAANQETVAGLKEFSSCVEKKKSWEAVLRGPVSKDQ